MSRDEAGSASESARARPHRKSPLDIDYLAAIEPMLSDWTAPEDAAAYDDLKPL